MRAQLLAAEAADAQIVINVKPVILYRHGQGRAMFNAGMATNTALMINLWMCGQQMFESPSEIAGDAEVDIGHFSGTKMIDLQVNQGCADQLKLGQVCQRAPAGQRLLL